jgi:hypothetical protein
MAKKTYISLTGIQYTFPVRVKRGDGEETVWVSLWGDSDTYVTSIKEVQEAIESSDRYINGDIGLKNSADDENDSEEALSEGNPPKSFPEVIDINMAVDVLSAEPYKVDKRSLKTPSAIRSKAKEYNVEFPNLNLE